MKRYTVEITHMERLQTLYDGTSADRARDVADVMRACLIVGNGSGHIILRENTVADIIWRV